MSEYIDFKVVGQVVLYGLLFGAGLPLIFAFGLRSLSVGTGAGTESDSVQVTKNPGALGVAGLCFLVVVAAIAYGIYLIARPK